MSGCIPWITGNVLADSSPGCYCSVFKGKYCRDIKQWGYLCKGKLEEKAVNSPGLAGSSSAAVHCRAMTTHTSWPFVLVSVGMGCFSEGGAYTCVHSWLKVHLWGTWDTFPPLSNTVIVGWNSMGCAEPAARQDDLYGFFSPPALRRAGAVSLLCVLLLDAIWHCVLWLSEVGSLPSFQPVLQV